MVVYIFSLITLSDSFYVRKHLLFFPDTNCKE